MAIIPAGFANAQMLFSLDGSTHEMSWGLGIDHADFGTTTPGFMAQAIYESYVGPGLVITPANVCEGWNFEGVHVTMQLEEGPLTGEYILPLAGTASASTMPPNCAILFNKVTAAGGRRNKGRAFVPPYAPGELSVDGLGIINSGVRTALQALYDEFIVDLAEVDMVPVLFHQTAPFTPTVITALNCQSMIATQRRRLRR